MCVVRLDLGGLSGGQNVGIFGPNAGGFVHRMQVSVSALEQTVGFRAHLEEGCTQREDARALEIHVASVYDSMTIERSGLRQNLVEDVEVVHSATAATTVNAGLGASSGDTKFTSQHLKSRLNGLAVTSP